MDADGIRVREAWGWVAGSEGYKVTNNHTEQIALTLGLEALPDGWAGTAYSDSQIALGRAFMGWSTKKNLPERIRTRTAKAVARLGRVEAVLLQGHPTKADLEGGIGAKRGLPVSRHNVWCDKACGEAKELWAKSRVVGPGPGDERRPEETAGQQDSDLETCLVCDGTGTGGELGPTCPNCDGIGLAKPYPGLTGEGEIDGKV